MGSALVVTLIGAEVSGTGARSGAALAGTGADVGVSAAAERGCCDPWEGMR